MPTSSWEQTWYELHTYADRCPPKWKWCPIHWVSVWHEEGWRKEPFPVPFTIKTSQQGWIGVWVYCGPGAYLPKRPR